MGEGDKGRKAATVALAPAQAFPSSPEGCDWGCVPWEEAEAKQSCPPHSP